MNTTIAERHAALLVAIKPIFHGEFRAGELLHACAGLAIKQPGHAELDKAIKALIFGKPTRPLVGKLLARMRDKPCGAYRLEGEYNSHAKGWRYWLAPADAPPTVELIRADAEQELEDAQELAEAPPIEQMTAQELERLVEAKRPTKVIERAQQRADKDVERAQRAVVKATVAADSQLRQALKDIRTAKLSEAIQRRKEREAAADAELPESLTIEESEFALSSGKYEAVYEQGAGRAESFRGWKKKRVSAVGSALNPYMTPEQERQLQNGPVGHTEERTRWVADPNEPGKLIKERYVHHVPYSGLAAADALCTDSVRQAGGSGVSGFINDPRFKVLTGNAGHNAKARAFFGWPEDSI